MFRARITSRGRVTIPQSIRERMGLRPGDELEFAEERGVFRVRKRLPDEPFKEYRGYLKHLVGTEPDELVREMRGE